jgi:ATP-dependent Clp protease protease subunit
MMDRIIFLGTGIDDQIANIVQAQLLFLESADASKDQIYLNSPGGSVYAGLEFMIRCNTSSQMLLQFVLEWRLLWERYAGAAGKRSALPHSRVMIHQPSGGAQGCN